MKHRQYAIYRVAVGPLVGQGWERERPTLPKLYGEENKAVGLGLFPFNALVGEDYAQHSLTLPIIICLPFDTINPTNAVSFVREHPVFFTQTSQ